MVACSHTLPLALQNKLSQPRWRRFGPTEVWPSLMKIDSIHDSPCVLVLASSHFTLCSNSSFAHPPPDRCRSTSVIIATAQTLSSQRNDLGDHNTSHSILAKVYGYSDSAGHDDGDCLTGATFPSIFRTPTTIAIPRPVFSIRHSQISNLTLLSVDMLSPRSNPFNPRLLARNHAAHALG